MTTSETTWRAFHTWGWDRHQYSPKTRDLYVSRCRAAERWIGKQLSKASPDDVIAWHRSLPATPSSRNIGRQSLVAFYDFLIERTTRTTNPARSLPSYRYAESVPRALDAMAAAKVLDAPAELQWRMAVSLLFHSALRCSEARLLEWEHVHDGWVQVTVKGGAQRMIPLHPDTETLIGMWRGQCPSPRWVFPSPVKDGPLSDSAFRDRIKATAASVGVDMTPHVARHTTATRLVEQGVDVRTVSALLGHASLATTMKYLRVWDRQLQSAVSSLDYTAA